MKQIDASLLQKMLIGGAKYLEEIPELFCLSYFVDFIKG